jgi:hypothetical protein
MDKKGVDQPGRPLDVAIMTEDAAAPHVDPAIAGRRTVVWYPVSEVSVVD